jgi:hypothetical protein
VIFVDGVSYIGATERQLIDSHWEKRYGSFFPEVCSGVIQLRAIEVGCVL